MTILSCNDTMNNDTKIASHKNFPTVKRPTAKCPYGEKTHGEEAYGEKFLRRSVLRAKCFYGEMTLRRSVLTVKNPTAKFLTAKSPTETTRVTPCFYRVR